LLAIVSAVLFLLHFVFGETTFLFLHEKKVGYCSVFRTISNRKNTEKLFSIFLSRALFLPGKNPKLIPLNVLHGQLETILPLMKISL
jgi:hypothetical protein